MQKYKHDSLPWRGDCRRSKIDVVTVDSIGISTELAQVYLNDHGGKTVTSKRRGNAKLILVACNGAQAFSMSMRASFTIFCMILSSMDVNSRLASGTRGVPVPPRMLSMIAYTRLLSMASIAAPFNGSIL